MSSAPIAAVRIEFVLYRRIEPLGQGLGAAEMRGNENDAVGRLQAGLRQVVGIAGGRGVMVGCSACAW